MARITPQSLLAHVPAIARIALEGRQLCVRNTFPDHRYQPQPHSRIFQRRNFRRRIQRGQQHRQRKQYIQQRLEFKKEKETQVDILARPLAPQLLIASVFRLNCDAPNQVQRQAQSPERHHRSYQPPPRRESRSLPPVP